MAVNDWLNANVVGSLSLGDIGSSALDFYNTWQNREGANKAYDEIVGGYDEGIDYLKETGGESKDILEDIYNTNMGNIQPYQQAGTTALSDYMNLMQNPERITSDPGYQFRYDIGSEAQRRDLESAGYADPMGSGARPLGMETWAQGFATQELDSALNRRIPPMELGSTANRQGIDAGAYYGRGLTDINKYMGLSVADMYGGKADALATKEMIDTMTVSNYIKGAQGLLNAAGNPSYMDLIGRALSGETDSDGNSLWGMLADAFGFDPEDEGVMERVYEGILGGDDNRPAGWGDNLEDVFDVNQGTAGVNDADLAPETRDYLSNAGWVLRGGRWAYNAAEAGTTVGAGTAAGEAGVGAGAGLAAATPLLGFAAVVALDQFLDDGANIGNTREKLSKSDDPIGFIFNMSDSDLSGLSNASAPGISGINEKRGLFFSTMVANMDPQGIQAIQSHPKIGDIVDDMLAYNSSSMMVSPKAGGGFDDAGLTRLFPEYAEDIKALKDAHHTVNTAMDRAGQQADHGWYSNAVKEAEQMTAAAQNQIFRISSRLYNNIYSRVNEWTTTNLVNDALN